MHIDLYADSQGRSAYEDVLNNSNHNVTSFIRTGARFDVAIQDAVKKGKRTLIFRYLWQEQMMYQGMKQNCFIFSEEKA